MTDISSYSQAPRTHTGGGDNTGWAHRGDGNLPTCTVTHQPIGKAVFSLSKAWRKFSMEKYCRNIPNT